jgi:uncharacterized protein (TIGR00106 family)
MLFEFSIYPVDTSHFSTDIAEVVAILNKSGLTYRLGPMSTSIEGDWDDVMGAIRLCHEALGRRHSRLISSITIDDRRGQGHSLDEMIDAVRAHARHKHDMDVEC